MHLLRSHPCMLDHGITPHPEHAGRLQAILAALQDSPYLDLSDVCPATKEELALVHNPAYIDQVLACEGRYQAIDSETVITPGTVKAALTAAGIGIELVQKVIKGEIENGFALVRPPGHHAEPQIGMGFCIFNNIAIAAKKALSLGLKRVMILDWDVHHGNGTQKAFYESDQLLFIDLHQDNLYPKNSGLLEETGSGKGKGFTVNIPLPDSCRNDDYLYIFEKIIKPKALAFKPELILVSAGFDAHESDPLGSMQLTTEGFGRLTTAVKSLLPGRLLLFLEGGYNVPCLAQNVVECSSRLISNKYTYQPVGEPYSYGMKEYVDTLFR